MAFSGDLGAASVKAKQLKLLLWFSFSDLRIPNELAQEIGSGKACILGPCDKTWDVEVRRDNNGAFFFGRGWQEVAAVSEAGEGWILSIRHHGDGLLVMKVFDVSCCLRDLGSPPPEATTCTITAPHKPQFISMRPQDFLDHMLIPAKFMEDYIATEDLNNHMAEISGPLGGSFQVNLVVNHHQLFLAGGCWSKFLKLHDVKNCNILVVKYEGELKFRVRVYEPNGIRRQYKYEHIEMQEDMVEVQNSSMTCLKNSSLWGNTFYELGPPSRIKKQINANTVTRELVLSKFFCHEIGLKEPSIVKIKTSLNSTEYWMVHGCPGKEYGFTFRKGWPRFCRENCIKEGDTCTITIMEKELWLVDITRGKELGN